MRKIFEDFKKLYKTLNLQFSIVCFSETWADGNKLANNSLIQLLGYNVLHQIRKNRSVGVFVHESLSFKSRQDMGINSQAVESFSIEILNKKCKNIILNTIYRSPNGDVETCENYFKNLFAKNDMADDFNLNVFDFENNKKVQNFIHLMFRYGMIPTTNKLTRVTTNVATFIDHTITNVVIDTDFKTGILKSCISDHFAIILAFQIGEKKCVINQNNIFTGEFLMKIQ